MQKRSRGGNVKQKAPDGYYTAQEAVKRLGLKRDTFYHYVRTGKIALYFHTHAEEQSTSETRVARVEDTKGIQQRPEP